MGFLCYFLYHVLSHMQHAMADKQCITWENFVDIHHRQLLSIGLPEQLWTSLYSKLAPKEIHDAGSIFELHKCDETAGGRWSLRSKSRLVKDQDVYLIDHAWTSDGGSKAMKTLLRKPELVKRMQEMLCLNEQHQDSSETIDQEKVVQQLAGVSLEKAKECLDKSNNDLIQAVVHAEGGDTEDMPNLNLDELEEKKVLTFEEFKDGFTASVDEENRKSLSEEFLQKMYKKYLKDSEETKTEVRYGEGTTPMYSWHETDEGDGSITVLVSVPSDTTKSSIASKVSPSRWTLGIKGSQTIIDGEFYSRIQPDECFWTFDGPGVIQMTLQKTDPSQGLWPFLIKEEVHLTAQQIHDEAIEKEHQKSETIHSVLEAMWCYNQTYQAVLVKGGPQEHLWYIMDEVGSALSHSTTPNMKCAPFAYAVNGVIYCLIWPITDVDKGDVCTRNFCPSLTPGEIPMQKEARLLACLPDMPNEYPRSFLQDYATSLSTGSCLNIQAKIEPLVSEAQKNPLPELSLKFYVGGKNDKVRSVLSSLCCSFVDKPDDATAIWVDQALPIVNGSHKVNYLSGDDFLTRRDVLSRILTIKLGQVRLLC
ncbi:hypothetical protein QZH41_018659 [Actinostola sp. cb2023]|nr:hypothetical protein QZH41_018659 [Actinostola sp. cb2023]